MKRTEIKSLSIDELWALYEATIAALAEKMIAEKNLLDERLKLLTRKQRQAHRQNVQASPTVSACVAEIQESGQAFGNVGRSR